MTVSLKMVSPTSVSVLRALEIILAYIFQVIFMQEIPNTLCIIGSLLVIACVTGIAMEEKSRRSLSSSSSSSEFQENNSTRSLQIGRTFIVNHNQSH